LEKFILQVKLHKFVKFLMDNNEREKKQLWQSHIQVLSRINQTLPAMVPEDQPWLALHTKARILCIDSL
jgi:hypothetical protein